MNQKAILVVGSNGGKWPFICSLDYAQDPSDAIADIMTVSYAALGDFGHVAGACPSS